MDVRTLRLGQRARQAALQSGCGLDRLHQWPGVLVLHRLRTPPHPRRDPMAGRSPLSSALTDSLLAGTFLSLNINFSQGEARVISKASINMSDGSYVEPSPIRMLLEISCTFVLHVKKE